MPEKIFLIGLPGTGKTTLGQQLAEKLRMPFIDLDASIVAEIKQPISILFEEKGEEYFRKLEQVHLNRIIENHSSFVLATGGGAPCFFDNLAVMKQAGTTIFLDTPISEIKKRIAKDTTRPLMKKNTLEDLYSERIEFYSQAEKTVSSYQDLLNQLKVETQSD